MECISVSIFPHHCKTPDGNEFIHLTEHSLHHRITSPIYTQGIHNQEPQTGQVKGHLHKINMWRGRGKVLEISRMMKILTTKISDKVEQLQLYIQKVI